MGFSFRKSIGFGPFKLNLSKSGVGVSTGVKGARISTGPSGTKVYGGWGPFRYQKNVAPGIGSVAPKGQGRGAWGVGTVVMLIVVVGAWAFTKYYKPPVTQKTTNSSKSHHTSSGSSSKSHSTKKKTAPATP